MKSVKNASAAATRRSPRTLAGSVSSAADQGRADALKRYEAALRLMQSGKYQQAREAFDAMLGSTPGDLAERIRMYSAACVQQMSKGKKDFGSSEEHYDYAVSLLNDGHYEDAREQFAEILKKDKSADYALYGLAVLASMTGESHTCLEHLTEAIRLNPKNRIQARADSDFQDMADDPRFTDLLYPEV